MLRVEVEIFKCIQMMFVYKTECLMWDSMLRGVKELKLNNENKNPKNDLA